MSEEVVSKNFIELEIDKDLKEGVYDHVCTRFPPEPNGYLHIGHAKSIILNYGLAKKYDGEFHMRFDDTNPTKEKVEFVDSIKADIQWLGADWGEHLYFASNYFDKMYEVAVDLIKKGLAYVSDLSADEMREYGLTPTDDEQLNIALLQRAKNIQKQNNNQQEDETSYSQRPWADLMYQLELSFNPDPKDDIQDIKDELAKLTKGVADDEVRVPVLVEILQSKLHAGRRCRVQIIPFSAIFNPASAHGSIFRKIIPVPINRSPVCRHDAIGIKIIPDPADVFPANRHRTAFCKIIIIDVIFDPSGFHVPVTIKMIP